MSRKLIPLVEIRPRPRAIHTSPCVNCPSAHFPPDPECVDIKEHCDRATQLDSVFTCAWREGKLCKGYCDYLNITEADLP